MVHPDRMVFSTAVLLAALLAAAVLGCGQVELPRRPYRAKVTYQGNR